MRRLTGFLLSVLLVLLNVNFTVMAQESPIKADIVSNMVGNIFFDVENAEFDVILSNDNMSEKSFSADFKAYEIGTDMNRKQPCIYSYTEDFVIPKTSDITKNIFVPLTGYGLYELEVIITDSDGSVGTYTVPFSNAVRSTVTSSTVGTGTHLSWYGDADSILYLVKNAGMGNIRNGIAWNSYERAKGEYKLIESDKKMYRAAQKYGIDVLQTLNPHNNVHDDGTVKSDFLREEDVEEYKAYLTAFLNEELVKNNVTKIEIMNEPESMFDIVDGVKVSTDIAGHTKRAEAYVRMLRATNDVLDTIHDKDYKVGIFAVTGIFQNSPKNFADLVLSKLSPGEFDAVSVHSYSVATKDPEYDSDRKSIREQADYFKKLANGGEKGKATGNTYNFNVTEPMWHTEFGYSSSTGADSANLSLGDEYEQATMLIRTLDELKRDNPNDLTYIYEMSSGGTDPTEREDNFEMVRSCYHDHPYSAKFSYLAVANYNSLTANPINVSRVESSNSNYITKYQMPNREVYLLRTINDSGSTSSYNFGTENVYYYDLFGNKLSESDVKSNSGYNLTTTPFYAVVGEDIKRAEPINDTKMQADVFVIRGRIPSGEENCKISLTVTPEDSSFGGVNFDNDAIFMDQCYTKAGGTFEFKIKVYEEDSIKAYIVTENDDLMVLHFGITKDENGAIKVISNGIDIKDLSFGQVDLSNLDVSVNLEENDTDYKIVSAIYKGERLVDIKIAEENKVVFDKTTGECDKLQVMVIKDFETILPLCEVYIKQ